MTDLPAQGDANDFTSLSMIISRSIYVAANGKILFFFMANIPWYIYIPHRTK